MLWDNPEGQGGEGGGKQGTHVYLWPIHVDVWQKKKSQYYNYSSIKINLKKKREQ